MKNSLRFASALALCLPLSACLQLQGLLGKEPAAAGTTTSANAPEDSPAQAAPPPQVAPTRTGATYALERPPTAISQLVYVPEVSLDSYPHKLFGSGANEISCASSVSREPLLRLELDETLPQSFSIVASGERIDGVMVVKDGQMYWGCSSTVGTAPVLSGVDWTPGSYEVYALSMKSPTLDTAVYLELVDPAAPADLSEIQTVALGKPLAEPLFFSAELSSEAVTLYEDRLGRFCKLPMPVAPDLVLDVRRPLASGVLLRPLFSPDPVSLRVEILGRGDSKRCVETTQVPNNPHGSPSYVAPSEYYLPKGFEGKVLVSMGTGKPGQKGAVRFVAYDATTVIDPLTIHDSLPETLPLEQRLLAYAMPLVDYGALGYGDLAMQKRTAEVFSKLPERVFVYPSQDLDAQTASVVQPLRGARIDESAFPRQDEPLMLLGYDGDHVKVMGADGVTFRTKPSRLAEAPTGRPAPLATPRPLVSGLSVAELRPLVPRDGKGILAQYERQVDEYWSCAARVASKYDEAIDREQFVIRSNTGSDVVVETGRASAIRGRAARAIEKTCGPESRLYQLDQKTARRLVPVVEKARRGWLSKANRRF